MQNQLAFKNDSSKVTLYLHRTIRRFSPLAMLLILSSCVSPHNRCSDNWKVTGFYTPVEQDFTAQHKQRISLDKKQFFSFPSSFISEVKMEGWGKTRFGWYLGRYGGRWHKSQQPLNAKGTPLRLGAIAVDNQQIPKNSEVHIPTLHSIMLIDRFIAVDVGSAIKKQHIDVYTGEGRKAKTQTHQVTGLHRVCINPNAAAPVTELTP
jgi:3D (Asp-Asp-Asp) domain-containing protein